MDDKVKIRCPACTKLFRERANRVRDGFQVNCQHCNRLITLNRDTEDPFIRRALKTAKEVRVALEDRVVRAAYMSES
jgi:transposase-like protein